MSSGLSWNEDVPYDNPENSEIKMIRSSNPVEYVLSQPMDFPPGKVWKYNGGTTQVLAAIIEKTTGKRVDQFAKEYLFKPLGIERFEWAQYPATNLPAAASISESSQSYVDRPGGGGYGYQFWLWKDTLNRKLTSLVACVGNGDQRIFIDKTNDMVVVVTAGNYNKWEIKNNSGALVKNYVYPALKNN
jgi:CubicO group peptidase (beta-lactamase class C family)